MADDERDDILPWLARGAADTVGLLAQIPTAMPRLWNAEAGLVGLPELKFGEEQINQYDATLDKGRAVLREHGLYPEEKSDNLPTAIAQGVAEFAGGGAVFGGGQLALGRALLRKVGTSAAPALESAVSRFLTGPARKPGAFIASELGASAAGGAAYGAAQHAGLSPLAQAAVSIPAAILGGLPGASRMMKGSKAAVAGEVAGEAAPSAPAARAAAEATDLPPSEALPLAQSVRELEQVQAAPALTKEQVLTLYEKMGDETVEAAKWTGRKTPWRPDGSVNLEVLETTDDINRLVQGIESLYETGRTVPDQEVANAAVRQVQEILGASNRTLLKQGLDPVKNPSRVHALNAALNLSKERVTAAKAARNLPEAGAKEIAEELDAMRQFYALHKLFTGAKSDAGRALRMGRRFHNQMADETGMRAILKTFTETGDLKQAKKFLQGLDSPELSPIVRQALQDKLVEAMDRGKVNAGIEIWKGGLLTGLGTHVTNFVSTGLHAMVNELENIGGSLIGTVLRSEDRIRPSDALTEALHIFKSMPSAWKSAKRSWDAGITWNPKMLDPNWEVSPVDLLATGQASLYDIKPILGKRPIMDKYPGWVFKTLQFEDSLWKHVIYNGRLQALGRSAMRSAKIPKAERADFMKAWYRNTPKEAEDAAHEFAKHVTYTDDMWGFGQQFKKFNEGAKNKYPLWNIVSSMMLPFQQTPARVAAAGTRWLPGVGIMTPTTIRAFKTGGAEMHRTMARIGLSTSFGMWAWDQLEAGNISGPWPLDPKEQEQWRLQGKSPFSVKIQDGQWLSVLTAEPIASPLAFMSIAHDLYSRGHFTAGHAGEIAKMTIGGMSEMWMSKPFLEGPEEVLKAAADPRTNLDRYVERMTGSIIPTIFAQTARMLDPVRRDASGMDMAELIKDIGDKDTVNLGHRIANAFPQFADRIPGIRENLPIRPDHKGDPLPVGIPGEPLANMALPPRAPIQNDEVLDAMRATHASTLPQKRRMHVPANLVHQTLQPGDMPMALNVMALEGPLEIELKPKEISWIDEQGNRAAYKILKPIIPNLLAMAEGTKPIDVELLKSITDSPAVRSARGEAIRREVVYDVIRDLIESTYRMTKGMARTKVLQAMQRDGRLKEHVEKQLQLQANRQKMAEKETRELHQ